jgi:hypothetical protein
MAFVIKLWPTDLSHMITRPERKNAHITTKHQKRFHCSLSCTVVKPRTMVIHMINATIASATMMHEFNFVDAFATFFTTFFTLWC